MPIRFLSSAATYSRPMNRIFWDWVQECIFAYIYDLLRLKNKKNRIRYIWTRSLSSQRLRFIWGVKEILIDEIENYVSWDVCRKQLPLFYPKRSIDYKTGLDIAIWQTSWKELSGKRKNSWHLLPSVRSSDVTLKDRASNFFLSHWSQWKSTCFLIRCREL